MMTTRVNTAQITAPNFLRNSENTYIRGVVLVLKKFDRPLQLFRPQAVKAKRLTPDTNYDRLIIIGEIETRECFAIIADSAQKSSLLFADRKLTIGAIVDVKEAIFSNSCLGNDRTNLIFNVSLPLEVVTDDLPMEPVPIDLNPSTGAMFHFCLPHRPLSFLHAIPVFPTCSGFLCDRGNRKNESICACLQKSTLSAWVMSARVISQDILNEDDDPLTGDILQNWSLTKLFCEEAIIRSAYTSIDRGLLREAVMRVANHVNNNGGWRVSGFYKTALTEENIAQNVQRVRICRITPATEIPVNLKYNVIPWTGDDTNQPPRLFHANASLPASDNANNMR